MMWRIWPIGCVLTKTRHLLVSTALQTLSRDSYSLKMRFFHRYDYKRAQCKDPDVINAWLSSLIVLLEDQLSRVKVSPSSPYPPGDLGDPNTHQTSSSIFPADLAFCKIDGQHAWSCAEQKFRSKKEGAKILLYSTTTGTHGRGRILVWDEHRFCWDAGFLKGVVDAWHATPTMFADHGEVKRIERQSDRATGRQGDRATIEDGKNEAIQSLYTYSCILVLHHSCISNRWTLNTDYLEPQTPSAKPAPTAAVQYNC